MEKIIYTVWRPPQLDSEEFREQLLAEADSLLDAGAKHLRICVVDEDVADAAPYRMENGLPVPDGIVSVWVNTAIYRADIEAVLHDNTHYFHGYLVTESEPLVNTEFVAASGERTHGMNQVVLLTRPPRLSYTQWLEIWHGSHTQVAIDTQSTFGYRQNVICRALTYAAPPIDAIIEENFPAAAISDRMAFYDAVGDQALYQQRQQQMIESCARFIDFDKIDCLPMSEYVIQ